MYIYSHSNKSLSARLLAKALDCNLIKYEKSLFTGASDKIVINWGASKVSEEVVKCKIINHPLSIARVLNRSLLFTELSTKFNIPAFSSEESDAASWIDAGAKVFDKDGVYTLDVGVEDIFRIHQFPGKSIYAETSSHSYIHEKTRTLIKNECELVRQHLGLNFCCVTIGWSRQSQLFYVLNVNTAPALTDELTAKYAVAIKEMVNECN